MVSRVERRYTLIRSSHGIHFRITYSANCTVSFKLLPAKICVKSDLGSHSRQRMRDMYALTNERDKHTVIEIIFILFTFNCQVLIFECLIL